MRPRHLDLSPGPETLDPGHCLFRLLLHAHFCLTLLAEERYLGTQFSLIEASNVLSIF